MYVLICLYYRTPDNSLREPSSLHIYYLLNQKTYKTIIIQTIFRYRVVLKDITNILYL